MIATSVADIRRAKRQGKIAALMGIEGGHAIEDSLRDVARVLPAWRSLHDTYLEQHKQLG